MSVDLDAAEEVDPNAASDALIPRLDFELADGCDHKCGHCYNVWTADDGDPNAAFPTGAPLGTPALLALMTKAVTQSGAHHLTLTGGEPMLRRDALDVIHHATTLVPSVTLITNGSHVDDAIAGKFALWGVRSVQLTLLAGDRALHDKLKGAV